MVTIHTLLDIEVLFYRRSKQLELQSFGESVHFFTTKCKHIPTVSWSGHNLRSHGCFIYQVYLILDNTHHHIIHFILNLKKKKKCINNSNYNTCFLSPFSSNFLAPEKNPCHHMQRPIHTHEPLK